MMILNRSLTKETFLSVAEKLNMRDIGLLNKISNGKKESVQFNNSNYENVKFEHVWSNVPFLSSPLLPRILTLEKTTASVNFLNNVSRFFDDYNFEYIMCFGTLLGSYVSHSMLAWDDDIDMIMHVKDTRLMMELAERNVADSYSIVVLKQCNAKNDTDGKCMEGKFKLFWKDSPWPARGTMAWKMPFVDVTTYNSNSTHVWLLDHKPWIFPHSVFYPIQKRPFSGLMLPSPKEPYAFFISHYWNYRLAGIHQFKCALPQWDHWIQHGRLVRMTVGCQNLTSAYPFVQRTVLSDGQVKENLMIDNKVYYSFVTNETFKPIWQHHIYQLLWMSDKAPVYNQQIYHQIRQPHK